MLEADFSTVYIFVSLAGLEPPLLESAGALLCLCWLSSPSRAFLCAFFSTFLGFFPLLDCQHPGQPRGHPEPQVGARGFLHEHPEHRAAGAEVSLPCSTGAAPSRHGRACSVCLQPHSGLGLVSLPLQVPQWHSGPHEGRGDGSAPAVPEGGDSVPAR